MSIKADLAAGIVLSEASGRDRNDLIAEAAEALGAALSPSAVWQSGYLPPELRGREAYGVELPRWQSGADLAPDERQTLDAAWQTALPRLGKGMRPFLRLRVDTPEDVRRLREIGNVDGMVIVPSLDSRGRLRSLEWRWPFRVAVAPGPSADEWLAAVQASSHHGMVYDAELCDPASSYDVAVVSADQLATLSAEVVNRLHRTTCVMIAGDDPVEQMLGELEALVEAPIAVAFRGAPSAWWSPFFHELAHDEPVDVAVEVVVRDKVLDALVAGPRWGLDITAAGHWFASVAPEVPDLEPGLQMSKWEWSSEGKGATRGVVKVLEAREAGADPRAFIPAGTRGGPRPYEEANGDPPVHGEHEAEQPREEPQEPTSPPRRLVVRTYDGQSVVEAVLPPRRDLVLAVRIAIPEKQDVSDVKESPSLPEGPGPTVQLDVAVRGDVWREQPPLQTISISREEPTQPSSWARFALTTPDEGGVVTIQVVILHQGRPLQAATYVSPVSAMPLPGERPTLTAFTLSGPDEPTEDRRQVDAALDGSGAELHHIDTRRPGRVLITDARGMLDAIEERVSQVLGHTKAPDSFDDPDALRLLIDLARRGSRLATLLAPLQLEKFKSIDVSVNPDTPILPLELVYAGPTPDEKLAKLCRHVDDPPPFGEACTKASVRRVCPYAFWGLHRSISRTVWSTEPATSSSPVHVPAYDVLYAATVIADDGATAPKPSDKVLAAAQKLFSPVKRVTSWRAWRQAVEGAARPNLLVVLGHADVTGTQTRIYIGRKSAVSDLDLAQVMLGVDGGHRELVLLIACASAVRGGPFGTLPGALTAKGAGAVVGTLSKIVGPQGATATMHLLVSLHDAVGKESVGDAVARARYSLVKEKRPIGLILVSHGELDTRAGA